MVRPLPAQGAIATNRGNRDQPRPPLGSRRPGPRVWLSVRLPMVRPEVATASFQRWMDMRVRVHRGSHEVGGSCVEVDHDGYRLVLDVGKPLSGRPGDHVHAAGRARAGGRSDPDLLGVLVSHPHLDHYGLTDQVSPGCRCMRSPRTQRGNQGGLVLQHLGPVLSPAGHLEHRVTLDSGRSPSHPFLVDHSASTPTPWSSTPGSGG